MTWQCQICGNIENNRVHRAREMMFGWRDEFDYVECGACGTIQIAVIPDLSLYYPSDYYSVGPAQQTELSKTWKIRLAARFAGDFFVNGRNLIGKYVAANSDSINYFYKRGTRIAHDHMRNGTRGKLLGNKDCADS